MRALPEVWVHRRPRGLSYGPLDGNQRVPAPPSTTWLHVLAVLTRNEFRARYRAQALGILWSLLNPLVTMGIFTAVVTRVFRVETPNYPVFVLIGFVFWQWIANALPHATGVFVANADIVKRTVFARQLLPLAAVFSYGYNFLMESSLLLPVALLFPHAYHPSAALIMYPVVIVITAALIGGVALATSVLNVIYRDVAYLVTTVLNFLYWLTPIIYSIDLLPARYRAAMLLLNPAASILVALRGALMQGVFPSPLVWAGMLCPTAVVLLVGWLVFRHYERMVLDYV